MSKFIIEGGHRLSGAVTVSGNKNESLPVLAACLLTDEMITLTNVPRIGDVENMIELLRELGAEIVEQQYNEFSICCKNVRNEKPDESRCASLRAAILLAGPLMARFGKVELPPPGGDVIGRRRLDAHFLAFKKLGATIRFTNNFEISAAKLIGQDIFLEEASVTGTANAVMAAVLARGTTILRNAACEPHIVRLCEMLNAMGAKISGIGTHILQIDGVASLSGTSHRIGADYLEVGSYIALAAVTRSEITIRKADPKNLYVIESCYARLGIEYIINNDDVIVPAEQKLEIRPDFAGDIPKIDDGIWPMFPSDLMSIVIVAATQAKGVALFFEKMYDGRMFFVDYLISMGARIVLCDPHRIVVVGPSQLYGTRLHSPDIRAGMALIIAALCASGTSTIHNIGQIDRGYENLENKLQSLGANIERIQE